MIVNGWKLYWHPAFKEQFCRLLSAVESIKHNRPDDLSTSHQAKLLKRLLEVMLEEIPKDPNHANYAQGNTLGVHNRHWRRAKFLKRFRLFFRFSTTAKVIIYAWVNDESTLRHAGAKSDAYVVFEKQIKAGNPPTDWDSLVSQSEEVVSVTHPGKDN